MSEAEILPPRKKITLKLDPLPEYVEPPPVVCVICETEQPGWQFGADKTDTPICWGCEGKATIRRSRLDELGWEDGAWLTKARTALWHLTDGVKNGRRAANAG